MISQWWSWILTSIGVTGLYLAGNRKELGWAIGFFVQTLWITYAIVTRQWGFIVAALAYATVFGRNWRKLRKEKRNDFNSLPN